MKITINDHRKIYAIQEEFSTLFPDLTIEFYAKPSKKGASPSRKLVKRGGKSLLECRSTHQEGVIEVVPSMTVLELKDNFRDIYGLTVEVSKKSRRDENAGPDTGQLSLQELNGLK